NIANYVVGNSPSGVSGNWIFLPTTMTHPFVGMNTDNYDALLMGDVTGNWCDPATGVFPCSPSGSVGGGGRPVNGSKRLTAIRAGQVTAPANGDVVIPVSVSGTTNKGIIAYQFDLSYDASVIRPQTNPVDRT